MTKRRPGFRADNPDAMQGFYSGPWTAHYIEEALKIGNPAKRRVRLENALTHVFWQGVFSKDKRVEPWFERLRPDMSAIQLSALLDKRTSQIPAVRRHTARVAFDQTPDYDGSEMVVMVTWLPLQQEKRLEDLMSKSK